MIKSAVRYHLALCALLLLPAGAAESIELNPDEILRRVISHSNCEIAQEAEAAYAYTRATMVTHYDERGETKKQTDRVYEVYPRDGQPEIKLISENGRPPAQAGGRGEGAAQTGERAKKLEFDDDLVRRYDFRLLGREKIGGRDLAVLSFHPRVDPPDDGGMFGKLLNELSGRLWVDLEDYQLARVEVRLLNKVSFLAGIAGAVEKMEMLLIRERVAPGVWLNGSTRIDMEARRLFSRVRFRAFENCTGFHLPKEDSREDSRYSSR